MYSAEKQSETVVCDKRAEGVPVSKEDREIG